MPTIRRDAPYVTFINLFRCEPDDQDEVVRINREIVDEVASRAPGFVSATIHRSTDGRLVANYLQWETAEHLAALQSSPEFRRIATRFAGLIEFEPHQFEVVHSAEVSDHGDR